MDETKRDDAPQSPNAGPRKAADRIRLSAAKISAGTSVGTAGQPPSRRLERSQRRRGGPAAAVPAELATLRLQRSWAQADSRRTTVSGAGRPVKRSGSGAARIRRKLGASGRRRTAATPASRAGEAIEQASDWARDQYEQGSRQLDQARDQSMQQFRQARGGIERFVSENPLMVGVVGLAAGLVIGALLPRTRQEDQRLRPLGRRGSRSGHALCARGDATRARIRGRAPSAATNPRTTGAPRRGTRSGVRSSGPRYQNH